MTRKRKRPSKRQDEGLDALDSETIEAAAAAARDGRDAVLNASQREQMLDILRGCGLVHSGTTFTSEVELDDALSALRADYLSKLRDAKSFFLSTDLIARRWWDDDATVISVTAPLGAEMKVDQSANRRHAKMSVKSNHASQKIDVFLLKSSSAKE